MMDISSILDETNFEFLYLAAWNHEYRKVDYLILKIIS